MFFKGNKISCLKKKNWVTEFRDSVPLTWLLSFYTAVFVSTKIHELSTSTCLPGWYHSVHPVPDLPACVFCACFLSKTK
jgi:hypothetical protein